MKNPLLKLSALLLLYSAFCIPHSAFGQGTAFTYQGRLADGGSPATGLFDLQFALFDSPAGGNALAGTNTLASVPVTNGLFTVTLDFGSAAFDGAARWLDIAVRTNGSPDPHLPLTPRQALTPTPYAIRAGNAALLSGQGTNAFAPATGSPEYVRKAGDTMTGPLNLPLNGLVTGIKQLVVADGNVGIGNPSPTRTLHAGSGTDAGASGHVRIAVDSPTENDPGFEWLTSGGLNWTLYRPANSSDLRFYEPTVGDRVTFKANGNVGIGTAGPAARLEVNGTILGQDTITALNTFQSQAGNDLILNASGVNRDVFLRVNGATLLDVQGSTGNVGIGTVNPADKVHILSSLGHADNGGLTVENSDSGGAALILKNSEGSGRFLANNGLLYVQHPLGNNSIVIDGASNVGIGTTTPTHRLHVSGAARFDGSIVGGGAFPGWFDIFNNTVPGADSGATRIGGGGDVGASRGAVILLHGNQRPAGLAGKLQLLAGTGSSIELLNGNVGVGLTDPQARLDVAGTVKATLFQGSGTGLTGVTPSGLAGGELSGTYPNPAIANGVVTSSKLATDAASLNKVSGGLMTSASGNVGIATANTSGERLEVLGGIMTQGPTAGYSRLVLKSTAEGGQQYEWYNDANGTGSGVLSLFNRTQGNEPIAFTPAGNVGIGTIDPTAKLEVNGSLKVTGAGNSVTTPVLTVTGGADVAEPFQMAGADIPKGAVVVIDEEHPGQLKLSESAYDRRVAGIVSGAGGVQPGITLSQQGVLEGGQQVALSGRVYVQADATHGPIKPGDMLTTSATPGHAMKVSDHAQAQGAILGKAMSRLEEGKGLVLVLVTLQ